MITSVPILVKIRLLFILIFICSVDVIFCQGESEKSLFELEIRKTADKNKLNTYFYKSVSFFIEKKWDSTLVYTTKHLSKVDNNELNNYSHYFRAYSFEQKRLLDEALKELNLITPQFEFYFLIKKHLGSIALEQGEFKKAIYYLTELIKLPQEYYSYFNRSHVLHNLGISHLHLQQFKKSEIYLLKSLKIREQQKDTVKIIETYGDIANLYYTQYKDGLAIPYFQKAYNLSKKTKAYKSKQNAAFNMAVVEENRKDFKKSLAYRKEYETWKDSLNDQNKIYEVAQLEKAFAVKQKQKEVSLLEAENKAKIVERNGLFYSVLVLLVLLGTTIYFYKEKIKTNKIIIAQKENLDELNATKDKLFSIVSHDLRSSVNALKISNTKLLDNVESKNIQALDGLLQNNSAIVNGAYNLLDNLLHWALLQTEQSYFEITSMRLFSIVEQTAYNYKPLMLDKHISFENQVLKSDTIFADQESLKIILRNLLDNAIKFSNPNGIIKVYTEHKNDDYCDLVIEDSGMGMDDKTRNNILKEAAVLSKKQNEDIIGTGLGLQLCKSMIKKNNGAFSIESELGKGTKMVVSLSKRLLNG